MFDGIMPACFQQIVKTNDVRLDIDVRMVNAIADTRLRRKVDHDVEVVLGKQLIHQCFITDGTTDEHMLHLGRCGGLLDLLQPPLLQADLVVVVHDVERNDDSGRESGEETDHKVRANEAGGAGYEDGFVVKIDWCFCHCHFPFVVWGYQY